MMMMIMMLQGELKLPSNEQMWKDIEQKQKDQHGFVHRKSCKIFTHWISYMDDIADLIGCKPNIGEMMETILFSMHI